MASPKNDKEKLQKLKNYANDYAVLRDKIDKQIIYFHTKIHNLEHEKSKLTLDIDFKNKEIERLLKAFDELSRQAEDYQVKYEMKNHENIELLERISCIEKQYSILETTFKELENCKNDSSTLYSLLNKSFEQRVDQFKCHYSKLNEFEFNFKDYKDSYDKKLRLFKTETRSYKKQLKKRTLEMENVRKTIMFTISTYEYYINEMTTRNFTILNENAQINIICKKQHLKIHKLNAHLSELQNDFNQLKQHSDRNEQLLQFQVQDYKNLLKVHLQSVKKIDVSVTSLKKTKKANEHSNDVKNRLIKKFMDKIREYKTEKMDYIFYIEQIASKVENITDIYRMLDLSHVEITSLKDEVGLIHKQYKYILAAIKSWLLQSSHRAQSSDEFDYMSSMRDENLTDESKLELMCMMNIIKENDCRAKVQYNLNSKLSEENDFLKQETENRKLLNEDVKMELEYAKSLYEQQIKELETQNAALLEDKRTKDDLILQKEKEIIQFQSKFLEAIRQKQELSLIHDTEKNNFQSTLKEYSREIEILKKSNSDTSKKTCTCSTKRPTRSRKLISTKNDLVRMKESHYWTSTPSKSSLHLSSPATPLSDSSTITIKKEDKGKNIESGIADVDDVFTFR